MQHLAASRIGQPRCQRLLVLWAELGDIDIGPLAVAGRKGHREDVARTGPPGTHHVERDGILPMLLQPPGKRTVGEALPPHLKMISNRRLRRAQFQQALPQHAELERIE